MVTFGHISYIPCLQRLQKDHLSLSIELYYCDNSCQPNLLANGKQNHQWSNKELERLESFFSTFSWKRGNTIVYNAHIFIIAAFCHDYFDFGLFLPLGLFSGTQTLRHCEAWHSKPETGCYECLDCKHFHKSVWSLFTRVKDIWWTSQ